MRILSVLTVIFHTNQLCERGTAVALYDYAHYNEMILGNKSVILFKDPAIHPHSDLESMRRFAQRFKTVAYRNIGDIDNIVSDYGADVFYAIKAGTNDGVASNKVKTCIHAVFQNHQPHGDIYAYVSKWLTEKMTQGRLPYVPHMIDLPNIKENLRDKLKIPLSARVFGRYGGKDTFDLDYVKDLIRTIDSQDSYFLFMNTDRFTNQKNAIFLDKTCDKREKVKFINTCDAMLHARRQGESFGLSCGEFSIKNKPVITNTNCYDRCHLDILEDKGIYYSSKTELEAIIISDIDFNKDWDAYSLRFSPEAVMDKFSKVFL